MMQHSNQEEEDGHKNSCCCYCWLKHYCCDDSNNKFPPVRTATLLISLLFYILDVGSDIYVACEHYTALQSDPDPNAGHYFTFIATVLLIVAPNITINLLSWILYTLEYKKPHKQTRNQVRTVNRKLSFVESRMPSTNQFLGPATTHMSTLESGVGVDEVDAGSLMPSNTDKVDGHLEFLPIDSLSKCKYIFISFIHLLMLGHIFRIFRLLYKRKQGHYSFERYRDISVLRLMEASLESAPQLLLQFYIIVVTGETWLPWQIIVTSVSIGLSTISLALAVADYTSAVKDLNYYDPPPEHDRKSRLSWKAYFLIIFWHLFMIIGRAIAFILFASVHGFYLFIVIGVHYAAMVYWMYWQQANVFNRDFKKNLGLRELICKKHICGNYGIEFLVAALNIFFYFKLNRGSSIKTLVPFYLLVFVENTLLILLWYVGRDFDVYIGYEIPLLVAVFVTFLLGLICLITYYKCLQPSDRASLKRNSSVVHPTLKLPDQPPGYHQQPQLSYQETGAPAPFINIQGKYLAASITKSSN